MSFDLLPGPPPGFPYIGSHIPPTPEAVFEPAIAPLRSGEAHRNNLNAGGGFGSVPASGEAVAGLKRQKHGAADDDDEHAVLGSGHANKTKRRRRGSTGHESATTNDEQAAASAAAACAICLEDFEAGDDLAVMPCAHRFHDGCLTEWLALSRLCPCCRHALPSEGDGNKGEAPPAVSSSSLAAATPTDTTSAAEGGSAGDRDATGANQGSRAREAVTRRSRRAHQPNVRLFGPEWTADTSDDGLGLQH